MAYLVKLVGLVGGQPTEYDDTYLVGVDFKDCEPDECHLVTVKARSLARRFPDVEAARQAWMTVDPRQKRRADGQPNRPLTAFTVSIEPAP